MKKILLINICLVFILTSVVSADSDKNFNLLIELKKDNKAIATFEGKSIEIDYLIANNRILLPIKNKNIVKLINLISEYEKDKPTTKTKEFKIFVDQENNEEVIFLKNSKMLIYGYQGISFDGVHYTLNHFKNDYYRYYEIVSSNDYILPKGTYIPLRYTFEYFGYKVDYKDKKIYIKK